MTKDQRRKQIIEVHAFTRMFLDADKDMFEKSYLYTCNAYGSFKTSATTASITTLQQAIEKLDALYESGTPLARSLIMHASTHVWRATKQAERAVNLMLNGPRSHWACELLKKKKKNHYSFHKKGPKVTNVFWAEGVRAASNYARHADEWAIDADALSPLNYLKPISRLSEQARGNAKILKNLGINVDAFFRSSHDVSVNIATSLALDDYAKTISNYSAWLQSVYQQLNDVCTSAQASLK